jgi:uncharacterized protein
MSERLPAATEVDSGDEPMSNHSDNPHFASILAKRLSRRQVLRGTLATAVAGMFGAATLANAAAARLLPPAGEGRPPFGLDPLLGFEAIPVTRADTATIPKGYKAQALIPWGTPITGSFPAYNPAGNTGAEQEQQVGSHHDGMHYFPTAHDPNGHGLLCVNHEYVDENVLHASGPTFVNGRRPTDEVRKEIAAHGVSVVEVRKTNGRWHVVPGRYNRRITAGTPMEIRGPVRGSDLVKTLYSPDGTRARGTINNCAHGYTPWGTYLTCEENWAGYFRNASGAPLPREQARYGVLSSSSRYSWETAASGEDEYLRFDVSLKGAAATDDYRNEANTQGWVVEIDPFDPDSVPVKRTAFGRFAHEGCVLAPPQPGQPLAFYMGDDAQNEYIYKFVTRAHYHEGMRGDALDEGTLYAARFNDDGTGEWLALDNNDLAFRAAAAAAGVEFRDQADVLVNARLAADVVGATRMDRPEWGATHPRTGEVYMTLTNNCVRQPDAIDAANPRGPNPAGHIIRWREHGNRSIATKFEWDIFVLAGAQGDSQVLPGQGGPALTDDNIFASPDGLWIDQFGIAWIQTDMSGIQQASGPFGENGVLAANPATGEIRRFLSGPLNQETTGLVSTPDGKNLFVNFQHPGDQSTVGNFTSNWPDSGTIYRHPGDPLPRVSPTGPRPRSATIVITRDDGGVVGLQALRAQQAIRPQAEFEGRV